MKVAAYYGTGDVRVEERPVPVPGPNQMVVKISYVGICGTDVEFFHGHCPPFVQLPMVLGHENSGVVAAVGEGVTEEDVKAKYENGVLSISIPKKEAIEAKAKKMIAIE